MGLLAKTGSRMQIEEGFARSDAPRSPRPNVLEHVLALCSVSGPMTARASRGISNKRQWYHRNSAEIVGRTLPNARPDRRQLKLTIWNLLGHKQPVGGRGGIGGRPRSRQGERASQRDAGIRYELADQAVEHWLAA